MGKSNDNKINYAQDLLRKGIPYRDIQNELKKKYGSGMSNTTLKNLQKEQSEIKFLKEKIEYLEDELELFKKLYFQLRKATKKKLLKE